MSRLRAIAEKLQLDKSNVSRRLRMAADGGYLRNLEDKRGKPGRWVIGDPLPESVDLLPDPAQLATADATHLTRSVAVLRWNLRERAVTRHTGLRTGPDALGTLRTLTANGRKLPVKAISRTAGRLRTAHPTKTGHGAASAANRFPPICNRPAPAGTAARQPASPQQKK